MPHTPHPDADFDLREREFAYSEADFRRVRQLIHRQAGISLSPQKADMVYSRLARRLRALNLNRFDDYLDKLEAGVFVGEWEHFVNALTTNLTSFFREPHHFEILAERLREQRKRPFRIWCSAASTGEEPYSLAITAAETLGGCDAPVRIIASDLDTNVLRTASEGVYSLERVQGLGREQLHRYFLRGTGQREGLVRVRPELQRMVEFRRINLLDSRYPVEGPLDALFCRNVMIYFDKATQREVLQRFSRMLAPDGLLFAGHSESFLHAADLFRSRGRTVYELANP